MDVILTRHEMSDAACVGVKRRVYAITKGRSEPHGSPDKIDPWVVDIESSGAEHAVAKATGLYWHSEVVKDLSVTPKDVGKDIQVRWTWHEHGHLPVYEKDPTEDRYVLVTGRGPRYWLAGWTNGAEAKLERYWRQTPRGTWAFWVPQDHLYRAEDLAEIAVALA